MHSVFEVLKLTMNATVERSTKDLLRQLDEGVPGYSSYRNMYVVGLFAMATFAIPLNFAVVGLLVRRHFWRSNVYILLFQLAIADLLVAVFCIVGEGVWNVTLQWYGGDLLCRFYKFAQMFSLYASTFILTGISIDRCVAVLFPLSRSGSKFRLRLLSSAAWLLAALCASPQAIIFHTETAPFQADFKQCVTHGAYSERWQELFYSLSTVAIMFFVPVLIMIFCYIAIFARITNEAQLAAAPGDHTFNILTPSHACVRQTLYCKARKTTLCMTLVFVICFIICWAPYYVGMFCFLLQINIQSEALNLIFCFGMCSAIINPIIFGAFNLGSQQHKTAAPELRPKMRVQLIRRPRGRTHLGNLYDPYLYTHAHDRAPKLTVKFSSRPTIRYV